MHFKRMKKFHTETLAKWKLLDYDETLSDDKYYDRDRRSSHE